jgi:uncharacterized protein YndB with AHSA1/START domain
MALRSLFTITLFIIALAGQALSQAKPARPLQPRTARAKATPAVNGVRNTSYELDGQRVLRHEGIVNASLEQVWTTCTTADGIRTYLAPVVEFQLKMGGKYDTNYRPGSRIGDAGTIHNEVLAYLPRKTLSFKVGLTDRFPVGPRQAGTLFAVLEFEKISDHKTKVTISMAGWGSGPDWDEVYEFFNRGNAYTLAALQQRFVNGPVNWRASERN